MSIIRGGKIVAIGNGGDGIRIGQGVIWDVAETFTAGNGGKGFNVVDDRPIPDQLMKAFLDSVRVSDLQDKEVVAQAAEKSGLRKWLAEHGVEAANFVMEFTDKAKDSDWVKAIFGQ